MLCTRYVDVRRNNRSDRILSRPYLITVGQTSYVAVKQMLMVVIILIGHIRKSTAVVGAYKLHICSE